MISYNAQVNLRIGTKPFNPDERFSIFQAELKFLLIHSGGGFQGRIVMAPYCFIFWFRYGYASSFQTSFASLKTAQPFGQPA